MAVLSQRLPVMGSTKENQRYYFTVKYKGDEYLVPMWHFQRERYKSAKGERPEYLDCIVHEDNGYTRITQDYAVIIQEQYKVGETYAFRVVKRMNGYYNVTDSNGLIFRLTEIPKGAQVKEGQYIEARVLKIDKMAVNLALVENKDAPAQPKVTVTELSKKLALEDVDHKAFVKRLESQPSYREVKEQYDNGDIDWLLGAVRLLDEFLLGADISSADARPYLDAFERMCIYLLEGSGLLKQLDPARREKWIATLTSMAQHAEDYRMAHDLIEQGTARDYIHRQLVNLQESENLYQPERKFRIIMTVFNIDEKIMAEMMDRIFDIILSGNKDHWRTEPFRTAFVNMLELFISEYRTRAIRCIGVDLIVKMVKAIAIQQMLTDSNDDIDRRLNRATYYRLLAYARRYASEEMLNDAFASLFASYDQELEYTWDDISSIETLYMRAAYKNRPDERRNFPRQTLRGADLELSVDPAGVIIQPVAGRPVNILSPTLLSWQNIEIRSNMPLGSRKLAAKSSIDTVSRKWKEIISSLLSRTRVGSRDTKLPLPEVGDRVKIQIIDESEDGEDLYANIISDTVMGKGWMSLKNVAGYIQAKEENIAPFRSPEGLRRTFDAVVISEPDEEGNLEFSMLDVIDDYFYDTYDIGAAIDIRIVSSFFDRKVSRNRLLGVSRDGASCIVDTGEYAAPPKGTCIKASIIETDPKTGQYICEMIGEADSTFNIWDGFRNLILALASDVPEDEEEEMDMEENITPDMMREIIAILDRLSAISGNRAQAYGMLCVAGILCYMLGDSEGQKYYDHRKTIIKLLDDYERNGRVDDDRLATLMKQVGDDLVNNDYILNESIAKFRILDSLKHRDNVPMLYSIRQTTENATVREAADLAIALLLTARFELPGVERNIQDKINEVLRVNVHTSKLRDFGIETQQLEFKSSIVFPPDNHMQPQKEVQGATIMATINAFLNSECGGQLLLGVNKNGGACGVDGDMKYLGLDEDGYGRYIHNMINREMGTVANQCCLDCRWIEDGGYKIYEMNIKPAPDLVPFRGQYWIRQDTEKRVLPAKEVEKFRELRNKNK